MPGSPRRYGPRMTPFTRGLVGVVAVAAIAGSAPGVAGATPSSGISAVTLAEWEIPADLLPFVPEGADIVVREITLAPGGTTGWHFHDGKVYALVRSGTLTHPGPDCVPDLYRAGDIIGEPPGHANTHEGNNFGTEPVVLDVLYVLPSGDPLSEDASAPECAGG